MILRYVSIDVIEPSVAGLDVDVATEYELEEPDEGGDDFLGTSGEEGYMSEAYDPSGDVPVWCSSPLILCLHCILLDDEEVGALLVGQQAPDTPHEIVHMQCHHIRTAPN